MQVELDQSRKANESHIRAIKQSESEINAKDIRLNRTLEDLEKLKVGFAVKEATMKERVEAGKRTAENLFADNKRLQKQKSELINGFKKQLQLIEVLKHQKVFKK